MGVEDFFAMPYIKGLFILVLFLVLARAVYYILRKYVEQFVKRRRSLFDELVIKKLETPVIIIFILMGFKYGASPLEFDSSIFDPFVNSSIILVVTHAAIITIDRLIDIWKFKWKISTDAIFEDEIVALLHGFSKFFILALGVIIVLTQWDVKVGALLTSLGIVGVAIGFALQDSLRNIFGGVSLVMDKSFKLHDVIELESGEVGEVSAIGMRSTRIITYDEQELIIPNGVLSNIKITNFAKPRNDIRISVDVAVAYGSNTEKVYKTLYDVVKKTKGVLPKPAPVVRFISMNDFSLSFKIFCFISDYKSMFKIKDKLTNDVYNALVKKGIRIPYPTRTVYLEKKINKK